MTATEKAAKSPVSVFGTLRVNLTIAAIEAKAHLEHHGKKHFQPANYAKWVNELNPTLLSLNIDPLVL